MADANKTPATDPALWTTRSVFGVAGGPVEVVLTDEGMARAFSRGAQVRKGAAADALEVLATAGGSGHLSVRGQGARLRCTDLGRIDQITWGYLRSLGLVESFQDEEGPGIRLTTAGQNAVARGYDERSALLARCRRAAAP